MLVSVIIPIAPGHTASAAVALKSVLDQTFKNGLEVILSYDPDRTGAAATRNRALAIARGLFSVFLDADDTLHPEYIENALRAYRRGHYVYTDWILNGSTHRTGVLYRENKAGVPLQIWSTGQTHLITCLIPTAAIQAVGGFDESLPTLEDENLFLALHSKGFCGVRVAKPLVNYNRFLGHSAVNNDTAKNHLAKSQLIKQMDQIFKDRYRGFYHMGCSNCTTPKAVVNQNEKQTGDVLVMPLYSPRKIRGASGRIYPKTGLHQTLWVSPQDYAQMPGKFALIPDTDAISPDVETVKALTSAALSAGTSTEVVMVAPFGFDPDETEDITPPLVELEQPKRRGRGRAK